MDFEKEILEYENANIYQKYEYREGTKKVIITSVHSMIQHKNDGIKKREPFTKAITKYVSNNVDCYNYIKLKETRIDSNSIEVDDFKYYLLEYIKDNEIKLLIDIHGAKSDRDFDIEFGTLNNLSIDNSTLYELKEAFNEFGIKNIKINDPFLGGGITQYIYENTDIDVIQIEINSKFRTYSNIENIKKICDSLVYFIEQYNEKTSN